MTENSDQEYGLQSRVEALPSDSWTSSDVSKQRVVLGGSIDDRREAPTPPKSRIRTGNERTVITFFSQEHAALIREKLRASPTRASVHQRFNQ